MKKIKLTETQLKTVITRMINEEVDLDKKVKNKKEDKLSPKKTKK